MSLEYPLDNQSKGSIEEAKFLKLQARQFKGGLPIFTANRTDSRIQGETYVKHVSGSPQICTFVNGVETCFTAGSGSGGGHTIQDEGVSLAQRTNLNFVGSGVVVTDSSGSNSTVVTIANIAGNPAGTISQIQYNNAGVFGAVKLNYTETSSSGAPDYNIIGEVTGTTNAGSGSINFYGANGNGSGVGQSFYFLAGAGSTNSASGGNIYLSGSGGGSNAGGGGTYIYGGDGDGTGAGGDVEIGSGGPFGRVIINADGTLSLQSNNSRGINITSSAGIADALNLYNISQVQVQSDGVTNDFKIKGRNSNSILTNIVLESSNDEFYTGANLKLTGGTDGVFAGSIVGVAGNPGNYGAGVGGAISFTAGIGAGNNNGGGITLTGGAGTNSILSAGGNVNIIGGAADTSVNSGNGGNVSLTGGVGGSTSTSVGGAASVVGGIGGTIRGGAVTIAGGAGKVGGSASRGGDVQIRGGDGTGTGRRGDVIISQGLGTTDTGGFFVLNSCAGTPTGTPGAGTGSMIYDSTNNKLWVYNSSWRSATFT